MSLPNDKSTKSLNSKSSQMFNSIISGNINRGPLAGQDNFEREVAKMSGPLNAKQMDLEISEKLVIMDKLKLAKEKGMPESVIEKYEEMLGFKMDNSQSSFKSNTEKLALLEAAASVGDPEIKAAILDMIYPQNVNDPLARVERLIKTKQANSGNKPESIQDKMFMVMFEKMMDRAEAPGQSPMETFTEMLAAVEKFKEATGQGKSTTDINTVDGLLQVKQKLESLGLIEGKSDKVEMRKMDIEEKKITTQLEIEKSRMDREFQERKDQMDVAKEMGEILSKAATKIFDKAGSGSTKNERSADKQPLMMYCTNPGCTYHKKQFEIANPEKLEDLEEDDEKGGKIKTKGRIFPCPNDRGGCPNKYILREGKQVEQFADNIDPRTEENKK